MEIKVVFHLDWEQPENLKLALENMRNLLKAIPPNSSDIRLVANGKAVNLFRKNRGEDFEKTMEDLAGTGVRFALCRNALNNNKLESTDILGFCEIVPAGVLEIIELQQQGFAYIKP